MNKHLIRFAAFKEALHEPEKGSWFQTTPPYGTYAAGGTISGKNVPKDPVIVFEEADVKAVYEAFKALMNGADWHGLLVDREHFSLDYDKPSDAMAWAVDIRLAEDGSLWTKWEFTPEGLRLWEDKVLICRSPVLELKREGTTNRFHPVALESIGMTNTPHFNLSTIAAAKEAPAQNKETKMPKVMEALGLPPEATEDEALAAIQALKDKTSAAEAKATDAEKEKEDLAAQCRKHECEAFLSANAEKIGDAEAVRGVFMKDPEAAKAMLGAFKVQPKAAPQKILAAAKEPKVNDAVKGLAACKNAAERIAYATAHAKELAEAGK